MSNVELNEDNIAALFRDKEGPVGKIIEQKAYEVENMMRTLLLIPGTGREYGPGVLTFSSGGKIYSNFSTGGRSATHIASEPGQPPSSDTGSLLASISHAVKVEDTVYAEIGSDKEYALYLENGTHRQDGTVGIEPRPFMVPALHIVVPG